ncbi:hypothetical protein ACER0C_001964 [Sarotherodon galilaeus]
MINDTGTYECRIFRKGTNDKRRAVQPISTCQGPSNGCVYFYRNKRSYENYQHPSFHGRVKLRDPEMKDGDVSLILKNVVFNDAEMYKHHVAVRNSGRSKRVHTEISHFIDLTEIDRPRLNWDVLFSANVTILWIFSGLKSRIIRTMWRKRLLGHWSVSAGLIVCVCRRQHFKAKRDQRLDIKHIITDVCSALQQDVQVKLGEDITLQCQMSTDEIISVLKWSRPDLNTDGYVYFYRNKRSYENYQHPSFHGRVKLRDPEMKDGDVSVILNNVTFNDTGIYECHIAVRKPVRSKRAHTEISHFINLTVTDKTKQCAYTPVTILAVQWSRADLKQEYVLLYRDEVFVPDNQHPAFKKQVDLQDRQMKDVSRLQERNKPHD